MPTLALRAIQAALAAALLLLSIDDAVLAQPTPAPSMAEDQRMLPYVGPGQLVDIGGRRINLHCTGAGGPTVILMAGLFSWSVVWYTVVSDGTAVYVGGKFTHYRGVSTPGGLVRIDPVTCQVLGTYFSPTDNATGRHDHRHHSRQAGAVVQASAGSPCAFL